MCSTPGCSQGALPGRRFCSGCTSRLARVREEIELGARERQRKSGIKRYCKALGCGERVAGLGWCVQHRAEVEWPR